MFSRSYDEYELESPRGSPTQSFSRSVTPRQPQQPSTNPTTAPPLTAELVIETIGYQNISCRQLAFLLYSMSLQDSEMFVDGMRKPYGSTRVEVVIALYNQISDIVNLPCLMKHLTIYERAVLIFRLGWLNIWSPIRPNGIYHLRFHQREERQLIRLLISLSLLETEKEWKSGKLFLSDSENILGGVDLVPNENGCIIPSEWHKEDGIPSKGVLSVEFVSKENEATRLKSHPPLLAYVLPTYLGQEDKLLKKRENITTTHCQFILHNTGVFLDLSAEDGKI